MNKGRSLAFTLVELLTVIGIIGLLAAILVPTARSAIGRARVAAARDDIKTLGNAVLAYMTVYGAPPPDSNASLIYNDTARFQRMDTPNECLVWFLTREFSVSSDATAVAGMPWLDTLGRGHWTEFQPRNAATVHARKAGGPFFDLSGKKRKDYDDDGFYEMVDPWGRPYLYRAYPRRRILNIQASGGTARVYLPGGCAPGGSAAAPGSVTIHDSAANNGSKVVIGSGIESDGRSWFEFSGGTSETPSDAYVQMGDLHNDHNGFDLYSVGPNGKTRRAAVQFASPYIAEQTSLVWGTIEDGHDIASDQDGNIVQSEADRDDISNWAH